MPATKPRINRKMFQRIDEQISSDPLSHDQAAWQSEGACGTRRCVGGWAVFFDKGTISEDYYGIDVMAQDILGLTDAEAETLFFECNDDEAAELVHRYAKRGRGR